VTNLEYRKFGATGLRVTKLCLGTATFGAQCDDDTAFAILDRADDLGISFIDTADKYPLGSGPESAGITESIIGRWWRGRRDQFILASKVHGRTGTRPWDAGLSRRHIVSALEASLRRLQTDYLDLYQLHRPDPLTPIEETLSVLTDFVRAGKVRYVGCSNFLPYQVARALGKSEARALVPFSSVQARYNLLFRQHERELLPLCREENLALITYNALAGGMLTGKHTPDGESITGTRFTQSGVAQLYRDRYWHAEAFDAVDRLREVADQAGLPLPTLSVAWLLSRPSITSVILGATGPNQLDCAGAASSVRLELDVLAKLDAITAQFRTGDVMQ